VSVPLWAVLVVFFALGTLSAVHEANHGRKAEPPKGAEAGALRLIVGTLICVLIYLFHLKGWLCL
jgi:hypothetical protein